MRRDPLPEIVDAPPGEIRTLLREVLAEVRALRSELSARQRGTAPAVDPDLAALPRAIVDYTGTGVAFSASELLEHADEGLRRALAGVDANMLGRRLARLEGHSVDGLMVQRVRRDNDGVVWMIRDACDAVTTSASLRS